MKTLISRDTLSTLRNACIVGTMLCSGLAGYAAIAGGVEPMRIEHDANRYMARGLAASEMRLVQDLAAHHPLGSDAGSLLGRLSRSGFECQPDMENPGTYACVFKRQLAFQRMARLTTRVETDGLRITAINPSVTVGPAPQPMLNGVTLAAL